MNKLFIAFAVIFAIALLGIVVLPLINRTSFNKLPTDQKIRILIKGAKDLAYFKNYSDGGSGVLYFVKNKRKIISFLWTLENGQMICKSQNPFDHWDYPEEKPKLTDDEVTLLKEQLKKYNDKSRVEIVFTNADFQP